MDLNSLRITPADLWHGAPPWAGPFAIFELRAGDVLPDDIRLPPCPLIGLGDAAHPLAGHMDVVIEPPVTLEGLASSISAHPLAAAVTVQLLRLLPHMPPDAGLTAESLAYGVLQGSAEHGEWLAGLPQDDPLPVPGNLVMERRDDRLELMLDNPARRNAIDRTMRDMLHEVLALTVLDTSITRVVLRGSGRSFSMGSELAEFGTTRDPATAHAIRQQTLPAHMAWRMADRMEAYVQGACVGAGLELAAWASKITARNDAWFQLPELGMGVLPGAGGCVSLTRRIGRQRTALMILSGKRINARQALGWGLIDALVDDLPA